MDTWSGLGDWMTASYEVDVAARDRLLLRWRYEKDGSVSPGEDTAWLDGIRIEFECVIRRACPVTKVSLQ